MHYDFPIIHHIDDVLPAIEGRDEFVVAERDGFTVINYNVGFEDTFTIDETDVMDNHGEMIPKGVMRRECRGIIFDADGAILSRPFHKFFNVGERDETQLHNLDLTQEHVVMEKMDGSMIRPLFIGGKMNFGTKMGLTDTAKQVDDWFEALDVERQTKLRTYLSMLNTQGWTPLFEFISPANRIVIEYKITTLVLLALRHNETGQYAMPSEDDKAAMMSDGLFGFVPEYGAVTGSFDEYIERQRDKEGREGDIIRFADGHMLKIKNDWYVRIHKVKDKIRTDRHILALLLENELDDVYPHLDENDFNRVKKYEADFHKAFKKAVFNTMADARGAWSDAEYDKKVLATEVLPNSDIPKADWQFVFKHADGQDDFNELVMKRVRSKLGNTAKYNELADWLCLTANKGETDE